MGEKKMFWPLNLFETLHKASEQAFTILQQQYLFI